MVGLVSSDCLSKAKFSYSSWSNNSLSFGWVFWYSSKTFAISALAFTNSLSWREFNYEAMNKQIKICIILNYNW